MNRPTVKREEETRASQALAAGELAAPLAVRGRGEAYVHYVVAGRLVVCRSVRYLLLRHNAVDFCENVLKGFFYISGVQGGGFNK